MADPRRPAVSVVIVARDDGAAARRLLAALGVQTLGVARVEAIVVDDGSSPPLSAAPSLVRTRLVRVPGVGAGAAANAGLRHARAPVVVFLTPSAVPAPDLLARHVAMLEEPGVGVVLGALSPLAGGAPHRAPLTAHGSARTELLHALAGLDEDLHDEDAVSAELVARARARGAAVAAPDDLAVAYSQK